MNYAGHKLVYKQSIHEVKKFQMRNSLFDTNTQSNFAASHFLNTACSAMFVRNVKSELQRKFGKNSFKARAAQS